jgi:acetoin utilization deacetylase AcuC-like enzyme
LLNNIALGAQFALKNLGLDRILLIDWDVHHGNGTQHAFESSAEVVFFSIHQGRLFPGTGFFTEAGYGRGEGYTVNVPLPSGYGDAEYAAVFHLLLEPIAQEFEPQLVLVSAGFDAHKQDPIGRMAMTDNGFAALVHSVRKIADTYCNGRYVLSLEGGYHIEALSKSIITSILAMIEEQIRPHDHLLRSAHRKKVAFALDRSIGVHKRYWKSLSGYRWTEKFNRMA